MSFSAIPSSRHFQVDVLTEHYHFMATLDPHGVLVNYLNHPDRATMPLKQVTATALYTGSILTAFKAEELFIRRNEIIALRLSDKLSSETMPLLPRKEKLRVFLPRFVVQADFHCGVDTQPGDLFDAMTSYWAIATDALVHSLIHATSPVFHEAAVLLVNRRHVRFYQTVTAPAGGAGKEPLA